MRVLLIQPPFWAVNSPSIGLSYLKAALEDAGSEAEILYCNLDFARRLGRGDYDTIQSGLPVEILFGDALFGMALHGDASAADAIPAVMRGVLSRPPATRTVPDALLARFPDLSREAAGFVRDFKASAPWRGFDLVGFTTTFTLVPALAMAKAMKEAGDAPPVVFGGSHCDGPLGLALMASFPWIDFVARGEGERLITSLVRRVRAGAGGFEGIDGLVWREGGGIRQARVEMARAEDLDALPVPAYHDWMRRLEESGWNAPGDLRLPIETSRGCWYGDRNRCTFCGLNGLNDRFRAKSGDRILREYQSLLSYGVPFFNAVDNVLDPRHFRDAIPRISALDTKATLFFEIRPTQTKPQLAALREAGVRFLQPGIESLSTRLLALMNKGTTALQNIRLLRWTAELGMPVFWNMLYGLPGETAQDYDEIAALVPSLVHLFPPLATCNRIHVDRFSPLFNQHQDSIEPSPFYALALGLEPGTARDLAYHFEFGPAHSSEPGIVRAVERLNEAVRSWHDAVGSAAFVSLDRGGKRWLFDSRPGAEVKEAELDGPEALLSRLLDGGTTAAKAASHPDFQPLQVVNTLDSWVACRWATKIDGHYLGLAVPMDAEMPDGIPDQLCGEIAGNLYAHRLRQAWMSMGLSA